MIRYVDGVGFRRICVSSVQFFRRALGIFFAATHARDARPIARQARCNCVSDPSPRAGDNRNLVFKSHPEAAILRCRARVSTKEKLQST